MCFNVGVVTCGPNEALVISGLFYGDKPSIVVGGRAIVFPCIQRIMKVPLMIMTLVIESPRVYTKQGVALSVTGVAQVKINSSNEEMLRLAVEQFGSKDIADVRHIAKETLEGHQRAIMGSMTVEQIYKDRKTFSSEVFKVASTDMYNLGISVISYTIKDIKDDIGYLEALGVSRTSEVRRDAIIGEAEAKMESSKTKSKANMEKIEAKLANDAEIAKSKRNFDIQKASFDVEVNTAKAEAELAFNLQSAVMQQKIKNEECQVQLVERTRQIELQEQEMIRKDRELEAEIKKPAEAEKYRLEKLAEADRKKAVLEAEAQAEAIALKGDAEAYSTEIKAKAEADQMAKKAEAWNEYENAAMVDMMLKTLPLVAAEVGGALTRVDKITMISDGSSEVGAAKLTNEVLAIMNKVPEAVKNMTGVDVTRSGN